MFSQHLHLGGSSVQVWPTRDPYKCLCTYTKRIYMRPLMYRRLKSIVSKKNWFCQRVSQQVERTKTDGGTLSPLFSLFLFLKVARVDRGQLSRPSKLSLVSFSYFSCSPLGTTKEKVVANWLCHVQVSQQTPTHGRRYLNIRRDTLFFFFPPSADNLDERST